jgi:hypothetical protein
MHQIKVLRIGMHDIPEPFIHSSTHSFTYSFCRLRDNSQIVVDADGNACDINGCIKLETNAYNMEEHDTGT